ncbi:MAG: MATE family efflux transporter [Erysipelotrichia bacterium]|nr:MATE family efflux transporter [Erysipelotrichia bacterium]
MTEGNPFSLIIKFMIPLLIGNIFQQFYNMCDTIIVGNFVGTGALAAVGSTGTIMFLIFGLSVGLTTGFTVLTSQRFGAGDINGTRKSVANSILLSCIVIVILTALCMYIMNPLLHLMNTPADIYADAYSYISVISLGIVCSVAYNLFSGCLRAIGNAKVPLYFLVFSACLNIGLDLLLVIVFHMGTAGAAWATNLAQGISAVLCWIYIVKKVPYLTPARNHWTIDPEYTRKQLAIGIPMSLQFAITASGTLIMQTAINLFGSIAVASFTATCKIINILTQAFMALGQTMATYCGQNTGKLNLERIKAGTSCSMKINIIYAIAAAAIGIAALPWMLQFFFSSGTDLSVMMPYAKTYMYVSVLFFIPLGMIFIYRNAMQGSGYGMAAMILGIAELAARLIVALISMKTNSYLLAVGCDASAWFTAGILSYFLYRRCLKDLSIRY